MKKVLLASTILAFSAGVAAAEMSLTGGANMGVKYNDGVPAGDDELTIHYEVDFAIVGAGETDNGLSFGASLGVDEPEAGGVNDAEVFISGNFGTLTIGDVDPATDGFGIADIGFDGIGVDDIAEQYKNAASSADVNYSYSFGDFGVILSADSVTEDFGAAVTYSGGTWNVGLGYAELEATGEGTVSIEGGVSFGDFSGNAIYSDWDGGGEGYGIDVSYSGFGAIIVTAAFAGQDGVCIDAGACDEGYGIGASYDLGGGAALAGGIGEVNGDSRADFGITMAF